MSEGATLFGTTVTQTLNVVDPINNASFISHGVPATMSPGQSLYVDIRFRNTGNTTWMPGGNYGISVTPNPCDPFGIAIIPPLDVVLPNQVHSFLAYITAPMTLGPCSTQLRMTESGVGPFGATLNLSFTVAEPPNAIRDWTIYQ